MTHGAQMRIGWLWGVVLVGAACSDETGDLQDVGTRVEDVGFASEPRDAEVVDTGMIFDAGVVVGPDAAAFPDSGMDAGFPDAGFPDTGIAPCTTADELRLTPAGPIMFPTSPVGTASVALTVQFLGCADVELQQARLMGPTASVDDFTIDGCPTNPCDLGITLCAEDNPFCSPGSDVTTLVIQYVDNDGVSPDRVDLVISTNVSDITTATVTLIAGF